MCFNDAANVKRMNKHSLETVKWGVIPVTNYKGCLVEKAIGGYMVLGEVVKTAADVDRKINEAIISIKNSLK